MSPESHVGLIKKVEVRGQTRKSEHAVPYMVLVTGFRCLLEPLNNGQWDKKNFSVPFPRNWQLLFGMWTADKDVPKGKTNPHIRTDSEYRLLLIFN